MYIGFPLGFVSVIRQLDDNDTRIGKDACCDEA